MGGVITLPGQLTFEGTGKKTWFEERFQFIPPPGFLDLNGPTTQRTFGMVRGGPAKFSRGIQTIGTYNISYLEYAIHQTPSKTVENERYIRLGTCPDGYGNT